MSTGSTLKAVLVATALLAAGACGSGDGGSDFADQSAKEIEKAATKDMEDVKSLRLAGTVTEGGEDITIDIAADTDGQCAGSVTVQGGTAEFIKGEQTFLKGDQTFWEAATGGPQQAQQVLNLVGDKWAQVPEEAAASFEEFCDLDNLLDNFTEGTGGDLKKDGTEDVDGEDAVVLSGENEDGDPVKAWIATEGKHYFLKVEGGGKSSGTATLSDFNEKVDAAAPADDEVVDLTQQQG
jgi:hypothetical protein